MHSLLHGMYDYYDCLELEPLPALVLCDTRAHLHVLHLAGVTGEDTKYTEVWSGPV